MLDRLVTIQDNTLTVCAETVGESSLFLNFTPIFSIHSPHQSPGQPLTLNVFDYAKSYYDFQGLTSEKEKINHLITVITRSPTDGNKTDMHQFVEDFIDGKIKENAIAKFSNDGRNLSQEKHEAPSPEQNMEHKF